MAEDLQFSSRSDNKRKFDDPSPPARRTTGFSAPIAPPSPDNRAVAAPPSYNSVPPPAVTGIELAKQRAQEFVARLVNDAESKRPRVENGGGGPDDSGDKGLAPTPAVHFPKSQNQQAPSQFGIASSVSFPSYGSYQGTCQKIEIPNGRVGVIIGRGGETIKYLQLQSGAKIQVTRDNEVDPNSQTRMVEITGTSEQINRAEQLIKDVLEKAEAGGSGIGVPQRFGGTQVGAEQFTMKVPNDKVGLIIGKAGETIKNMQAKSGARIQIIPLHLPPGDTSTERTVHIDGTAEQIESAKQAVNEAISADYHPHLQEYESFTSFQGKLTEFYRHVQDKLVLGSPTRCGCVGKPVVFSLPGTGMNRVRNPQMTGGYSQQGYYPPRPPTSWGPPGQPPMQQPAYGYMQPGAYPGAPPQYIMSQPPYGGYAAPPASGGYPPSGWDYSSDQSAQQTTPGTGYDYYNQQPVGGSAPADNTGYNYSQPPIYSSQGSYGDMTYSQAATGQQQGYGQDNYSGGYQTPVAQSGYSQSAPNPQGGYDNQQGYGSAMANPTQDVSANTYGVQGGSTEAPPSQQVAPVQPSPTQQGYIGQPPSTAPPSYPSQGSAQQGYGMPPTSQPGYGGQPPAQSGYPQSVPSTQPCYGQPPQGQNLPPSQAVYGQSPQPLTTQASYVEPAPVQPGFLPAFGAGGPQPGYGQQQAYGGAPPSSQPGYGKEQ